MEKKTFKVKALTRFLFAPTGRIYDAGDVFEVKNENDMIYLTEENKLCKKMANDVEISETEQDKKDKLAAIAIEKEAELKKEINEIIDEVADKVVVTKGKKK